MLDSYETCLLSLQKSARKLVHQLRGMTKRKKPLKRRFFDSNWPATTTTTTTKTKSFAAMEVSNQLKQVFEFLDANGDGKISPFELSEVLFSLGHHDKSMATKEAEGMVREMDSDGDGLVDMDEFIKAVNIETNEDGDDLRDAFLIFDYDKNGLISAKELRRVLVSLGYGSCSVRECREMIRGVDRDGDGFVDFEEFSSMMRGPKG